MAPLGCKFRSSAKAWVGSSLGNLCGQGIYSLRCCSPIRFDAFHTKRHSVVRYKSERERTHGYRPSTSIILVDTSAIVGPSATNFGKASARFAIGTSTMGRIFGGLRASGGCPRLSVLRGFKTRFRTQGSGSPKSITTSK